MSRISINHSNFAAEQCGYHPDSKWGDCVRAVNEFYEPIETFANRFEEMLLVCKSLGYDAVDIWTAGQMNWSWTTDDHIAIANRLLQQHQLAVTSIGGAFGSTREEFLAACHLTRGLGIDLMSGTTELLHTDRDFVVATLKEQNLRLGIENHPEKNPEEMLAQIGDTADGHIGTTIDTGWYATQSYDVPTAIEKLFPHIFHVHLKDVLPPGDNLSHINCGHGKGIVPIEACVRTLHRLGYAGDYSNENHCLDHDPREELRIALPTVLSYLE
jgi:L-ribulose-5-phosphate 3-epimerase